MMTHSDTNLQARLIELEERFWTAGADFYDEHLAANCLMVFPGMEMMSRDAVIASLAGGSRWTDVRIESVRLVALAGRAVILAYAARARRAGLDTPYSALVSSAYVEEAGAWKLAFHQHSVAARDV